MHFAGFAMEFIVKFAGSASARYRFSIDSASVRYSFPLGSLSGYFNLFVSNVPIIQVVVVVVVVSADF